MYLHLIQELCASTGGVSTLHTAVSLKESLYQDVIRQASATSDYYSMPNSQYSSIDQESPSREQVLFPLPPSAQCHLDPATKLDLVRQNAIPSGSIPQDLADIAEDTEGGQN